MQELAIKDLTENFFEAIGKEWMLVTSGSKEKFNTMTASWGGIGFLWNKAVAFIFIRPERYTYEFIEKNDMLTLSFLGSGNRSIYNICGSKSGRDTDKIKESGLLPLTTPDGNVTFEQARLTLEYTANCYLPSILSIKVCQTNGMEHREISIKCMSWKS